MPYSDPRFDKTVEKFIKLHKFNNYLDIGAGAGKYGAMIRNILPEANITGIEADNSYIKQFKLKDIYNTLRNEYIERFIEKNPDFITDLVIIGDCIEHLYKSSGLDLIHYLMYRTKYIIIVYPTQCIQYSWRGHETEAHRSVWNNKDFHDFEHRCYKKGFMNLVIIRGFIGDQKTIIVED